MRSGFLLLGLLLWLPACSWFGEEEEVEEVVSTAPRLVGRISSVSREQGFVLIESFGEWGLGEGLLLSSLGEDGRRASLRASGEKMGRFAAADLLSGEVEAGDRVFGRPMPALEGPDSMAEPAVPAEGGGG